MVTLSVNRAEKEIELDVLNHIIKIYITLEFNTWIDFIKKID